MRGPRRSWFLAPLLLALCFGIVALAQPPETSTPEPSDPEDSSLWSQVVELYEAAKESGEKVPGSLSSWFKEDMRRIGTWEYRVLDLTMRGPDLETKLNELGVERWDCFSIRQQGPGQQLICKRPFRSYLGAIKLTDLVKLLPLMDGAGGS